MLDISYRMSSHKIGVISDTHGLLRPQAVEALRGVDQILHAGDIGKPEVLDGLREIAPLTAIRGNNDKGPWADTIAELERIEIGGISIYMLHNLKKLELEPSREGINVVIAGHSHKPLNEIRGGVLYLNPGSAGPRRFKLPVSIAHLRIENGSVMVNIIELDV
jgi:putative phosphoesterase